MRIRIGPDFQIQCIVYGKWQNHDCAVHIAVKRLLEKQCSPAHTSCTVACCTNLGTFAYIDAAANEPEVAAILEMSGVTVDQDYCLKFYYHMHGSDIYRLAVYVDLFYIPQHTITSGRSPYYTCTMSCSCIPSIKTYCCTSREFWATNRQASVVALFL